MGKIESPAWAPQNIGDILKQLRTACGIKNLSGSTEAMDFCRNMVLSLQLYKRVECGKRAITEDEIRTTIRALHSAVGDRLLACKEIEMPKELRAIIQEQLDSPTGNWR